MAQCPKHRKADLELAPNSFQRPPFLLKEISDSSTLDGLGYQERESEVGEQADASTPEERSGTEAGSLSIHLLRRRVDRVGQTGLVNVPNIDSCVE